MSAVVFPCYDIGGRETSIQHTILSELGAQDEREILFVATGCRAPRVGLTTLSMNLFLRHKTTAVRIPASGVTCARDVMRWVYAYAAQGHGQTKEDRLTVIVHLPAPALVVEKVDDDCDGVPDRFLDERYLDVLCDIKSGHLFGGGEDNLATRVIYPPRMLVVGCAHYVSGLPSNFAHLSVGDFMAKYHDCPIGNDRCCYTERVITKLKRPRDGEDETTEE